MGEFSRNFKMENWDNSVKIKNALAEKGKKVNLAIIPVVCVCFCMDVMSRKRVQDLPSLTNKRIETGKHCGKPAKKETNKLNLVERY